VDIKKTKEDRGGASPDGLYVERAVADGFAGGGTLPDPNGQRKTGVMLAGPLSRRTRLLLRRPPRLINGEKLQQLASETAVNTANRIVLAAGKIPCLRSKVLQDRENICGRANDLRTREGREEGRR